MALRGGPLTRYEPCALGALHFDKISDKFWQGVVNLHLYSEYANQVEFNVYFDKQVKIYGVSPCFSYFFIHLWGNVFLIIEGRGSPAETVSA